MRFNKAIAIPVLAAGLVAGSAGIASAATAKPAIFPLPTPNVLTLTFDGGTYTYPIHLTETWIAPGEELISGWLLDKYEATPTVIRIHGLQVGDDATFNANYTGVGTGVQGDRSFNGIVAPWPVRSVTGVWDETGTEAGTGTFTLTRI